MYRRQPKPDAAHADGRGVAHVSEPEHAHHQPVRAERVPRAAAAAVQQPARPDDERAARSAVPRARPPRPAAQRLRVWVHQPPAPLPRHADPQLHHASVAETKNTVIV